MKERQILIAESGSIAEAALKLNDIFKSADNAASQYLENIKRLSSIHENIYAQREAESKRKALAIIAEAERQSEVLMYEAKIQAQNYWEEVYAKVYAVITSQRELRQLLNERGLIGNNAQV